MNKNLKIGRESWSRPKQINKEEKNSNNSQKIKLKEKEKGQLNNKKSKNKKCNHCLTNQLENESNNSFSSITGNNYNCKSKDKSFGKFRQRNRKS